MKTDITDFDSMKKLITILLIVVLAGGTGLTACSASTGKTKTETAEAGTEAAIKKEASYKKVNSGAVTGLIREYNLTEGFEAVSVGGLGLGLIRMIANASMDEEERAALEEENRKLRLLISEPEGMVGQCKEMRLIAEQIRLVASSDATVLIRGASGTGKELVAKAIVAQSSRRDKPFISLNCAALPEELVESELFGHEKGAFTGAVSRRVGRAEEADGGTLFLDEIGDLSPQVQVKLLRFLQERTFSRVGSNRELHSDVRFLAATSRDLEQLMKEGRFREDLYYRLNIFPIFVPELCRRQEDILLLAEHFINRFNAKYRKNIKRLSSPARKALMDWHWPGNVRELENCIERAVLTAGDSEIIRNWHLPPELTKEEKEDPLFVLPSTEKEKEESIRPLSESLQQYERELLIEALRRNGGNLSAAGRELCVSPRMMTYRVSRLGILREDFS